MLFVFVPLNILQRWLCFNQREAAPDGADAVFYEVWDAINVDGEERVHRNHDRAFQTEAEAQAWIDKQTSGLSEQSD